MKLIRPIVLLFFICQCQLAAALPPTPLWPQYRMVDLGTLGTIPVSSLAFVHGLNEFGTAVGWSWRTPDFGHATRWTGAGLTPGTIEDLGGLMGGDSVAYGINDSGLVVGVATLGAVTHPVVWNGVDDIDVLGDLPGGATGGTARAINNSGVAVGVSHATTGDRAFRWTAGAGIENLGDLAGGADFSDAKAINQAGDIVGVSAAAGGNRAFAWREGEGMVDLGTLPGGNSSVANDINDVGQIVGNSTTNLGGVHNGNSAAIWMPDGSVQSLGSLGPGSTKAAAINNLGWVVGQSFDAEGLARGYLWTSESGMTALDDLVVNPDPNYRIFDTTGINDRGQITAWAFSPNTVSAILLTPVPEPTGVILVMVAALGLVSRCSRHMRARP